MVAFVVPYLAVPNASLTTCWFALFQKFWITKPYSGSSFVNGPNIAWPEGSFQSACNSQPSANTDDE